MFISFILFYRFLSFFSFLIFSSKFYIFDIIYYSYTRNIGSTSNNIYKRIKIVSTYSTCVKLELFLIFSSIIIFFSYLMWFLPVLFFFFFFLRFSLLGFPFLPSVSCLSLFVSHINSPTPPPQHSFTFFCVFSSKSSYFLLLFFFFYFSLKIIHLLFLIYVSPYIFFFHFALIV